jgi:ABC-2 type transport system permease protein
MRSRPAWVSSWVQQVGRPVPAIAVRHWFNPNLNYRWFIVPSLSGISGHADLAARHRALDARERELGTFDQLLVSPAQPLEIVIGKMIPALLVGTLLGCVMISAGVFVFRIPFTGSIGWLFASLMLFILSMVGVGLMVSSICHTQQQAILGVFSVAVPFVLISASPRRSRTCRSGCSWSRAPAPSSTT